MHSLALLAALATVGTAQLNFTSPDPSKPLNLAEPVIIVGWTIPADSKYAPFNTSASLFFKGPNNLEHRIPPSPFTTGQGTAAMTWEPKDFLPEARKTHNFTSGKDYFFELQFFNALEGSVEKSEKFKVEGLVQIGTAAGVVRAGWGAAVAVAGVVGAISVL